MHCIDHNLYELEQSKVRFPNQRTEFMNTLNSLDVRKNIYLKQPDNVLVNKRLVDLLTVSSE